MSNRQINPKSQSTEVEIFFAREFTAFFLKRVPQKFPACHKFSFGSVTCFCSPYRKILRTNHAFDVASIGDDRCPTNQQPFLQFIIELLRSIPCWQAICMKWAKGF
ncbi:hypothetical protein L0337_19815 [candidate division KSB1 bacterium]|nr:hypothetical protein [candidate division KSB1 bacterium]